MVCCQRAQIVGWILQRPLRRQPGAARWQALVDHPVGVLVDRRGELAASADLHEDRATGLGAEVHPERIFFRHWSVSSTQLNECGGKVSSSSVPWRWTVRTPTRSGSAKLFLDSGDGPSTR